MRPGGGPVLSVERACEMAAEAIRSHEGSVLNIVPGMMIAEFAKSANAVRSALEIQRRLSNDNENAPRYASLDLRIGIFAESSAQSTTLLAGESVNASTKFARRSGPGQILISRGVHEAVNDDSDLQCQWVSTLNVEHAGQPEDVFEVSYSEAPACVPARYEVLSRVGTGGMGIVYKVRDLDAREVVALKILKPEAASNEAMQENLRREVFLARKVTHKNVCRIHEFNRSKGTAYISMEFIEGESLLRKLRRSCALPVEEAVRIVRQMCAGLREAHLQGIVHRDLKPANIMLDGAGNVKIMDFGIARLAQENVQHTGTIAGTPSYMAPEQVNLQPVGPRTDIYSIGLIFYEMVVGKQTFEGENSIVIALKQLNEAPKKPREIVPELSARVEDVILKCLEKDPAKRFQSIDEFEVALEASVATPVVTSLANAMETDLRRAGQNIHALVSRGVEKARPAVPAVVTWTQEVQRATARVELKLRFQVRDAAVFCGGHYRRWLGFTSKGQAVTASVAVGFLLVGVVAFARSSRNSYASNATPGGVSAPATAGVKVPGAIAAAAPVASASGVAAVTAESVDLSAKLGVTDESDALAAKDGADVVPAGVVANPTSVVQPAVKAPGASVDPVATASVGAHAGTAKNARATRTKKGASNSKTVLASTAALPIDDVASEKEIADAAKLTAAPSVSAAPAAAPKPADTKDTVVKAATSAPLAEPYLEVASYKDQLVADQTVSDISKLGLHAFSVQKAKLWMETFHVEVGPFTNSVDMAAAQKELTAKGFKSHAVK